MYTPKVPIFSQISKPHLGRKTFVLLTTSLTGLQLAKGLIETGHLLVKVGVGTTDSSQRPIGAIGTDDVFRALGGGVPVELFGLDSESELIEMLSSEPHDFALLSWPKLLSRKVIEAGAGKIIGTHPTPLPLGRGRHPLHWMQVLGIRITKLTAFWVDEGVDSGRTIAAVRLRVSPYSHVKHNHKRLSARARGLGRKLGIKLLLRIPAGTQQNDHVRTSFRRRSEVDSAIDFRMTAGAIVTHVRSISEPWPLSRAILAGLECRVADAKFAPFALANKANRWSTFGSVLRRTGRDWVLVRCYQGAVWLKLDPDSDSANDWPW